MHGLMVADKSGDLRVVDRGTHVITYSSVLYGGTRTLRNFRVGIDFVLVTHISGVQTSGAPFLRQELGSTSLLIDARGYTLRVVVMSLSDTVNSAQAGGGNFGLAVDGVVLTGEKIPKITSQWSAEYAALGSFFGISSNTKEYFHYLLCLVSKDGASKGVDHYTGNVLDLGSCPLTYNPYGRFN